MYVSLLLLSCLSGAAAVIRATNGQGSGVFIDGLHKIVLANCHYKTCGPDEDQCCEMAEQDEIDFNNAMVQSVNELRAKLVKLFDVIYCQHHRSFI